MTCLTIPVDVARPRECLRGLAAEIRRRLRCHLRALTIELADGGLVLHGLAYTFYGKQLTQHEVMRHSPLRILTNRIEVIPDPTP